MLVMTLGRLSSVQSALVLALIVAGCGTVDHKLDLQAGYAPATATQVEVGTVGNQTAPIPDVDAVSLLRTALTSKLQSEGLLWLGDASPKLSLNCNIVEYEPGNAFKRWMMPGWGSTVLSVQCDLKDATKLVGSATARRTVSVGGGYTIGAWRTIFNDLAGDVVSDLRSQLRRTA